MSLRWVGSVFVLSIATSFGFTFGSLWADDSIAPSPASPSASSPALSSSAPWDMRRLEKPPAMEWIDEQSSVRALFYEGEPLDGKPTRVFAYYATPGTLAGDTSTDADLPAVVLVHGGGGTAFREWAELWAGRGYAAIAMDLAGHRPIEGTNAHQAENRQRLADGGPEQGDEEKFGGVDQPPGDQWPYHAVASVIRAHSLIRSFPGVDRDRTAVTGISWGGYLTCIVAGVDHRFGAAVPVYGCGYLHENSAWLGRLDAMTPEQRQRWVALWDPSRYLPSVAMPILFVNGTNDFAYPLDSYMKSFDAVPGKKTGDKQMRVTVNLPHGHQAGWAPEEIGLFIDHHLLGKPALPILGDPVTDGEVVTMTWEGVAEISAATLHFTTDGGAINQRQWQDREATIQGATITVTAPPEGTTAWFLTAKDQRGAVVSSVIKLP
jgi:dienelactone hydrolase